MAKNAKAMTEAEYHAGLASIAAGRGVPTPKPGPADVKTTPPHVSEMTDADYAAALASINAGKGIPPARSQS